MKAVRSQNPTPPTRTHWTLSVVRGQWSVVSFCCSLLLCAAALQLAGCGSTSARKANANFFTSGNRAADQRASQRMAQAEQLTGSENNSEDKAVKKAKVSKSGEDSSSGTTNAAAKAPAKLSLYEKLGSEAGISNIVENFLPRAMDDPRVNWDRKGVTRGGFSFHHWRSVEWKPTTNDVALLKKHITQFLALATGGPPDYTGQEIEPTHAHLHISNPEFDAVVGDLKASLDELKIPNTEQKDLLAVIESTRPQIVTER